VDHASLDSYARTRLEGLVKIVIPSVIFIFVIGREELQLCECEKEDSQEQTLYDT
jgi:hypothetical protein